MLFCDAGLKVLEFLQIYVVFYSVVFIQTDKNNVNRIKFIHFLKWKKKIGSFLRNQTKATQFLVKMVRIEKNVDYYNFRKEMTNICYENAVDSAYADNLV